MPNNPPRCRHLHTDGRQCGSPAVRHEKLCYQHHSARQRPAHTPTLPDPEDLHAVQRGLAELLRLVARELIEDRQAKRLFAILAAAGTNLARIDRARRADRELDLRERLLARAELRLRAEHPASTEPEPPVTDPVQDPELGLIAPGPDPAPADPGCPTFGAVSPRLRWDSTKPESPSETPSRARQAELEAEAAEHEEFMRQDRARTEERRQLCEAAYQVMYQNLSPEDRAREDERFAAETAAFFGYTLEEIAALPSTPVLALNPEIPPQPL